MKAPGALILETMLEHADHDALAAIGSLTPREAALVHIANYDRLYMRRNGIRVPPDALRMLADEAEALAREYRAVAEQREREAS